LVRHRRRRGASRPPGCCRRSLGGEAFRGEWLVRRRFPDIRRRRGSFFPDLGQQPGLNRGGCPLSLHIIMGESACLEDNGAQLGDAAATSVVECTSGRPGPGIASCRSAISPAPSRDDACGPDAGERRQGSGRRFRHDNSRAPNGRRRQKNRALDRATAPLLRFLLRALVWSLQIG